MRRLVSAALALGSMFLYDCSPTPNSGGPTPEPACDIPDFACPDGTKLHRESGETTACSPGASCQRDAQCKVECLCNAGDTKCEGETLVKTCVNGRYVETSDCASKGGRCKGAVGTAGCDNCPDPNQKRCGGAGVCTSIWTVSSCGDCDKACVPGDSLAVPKCVVGQGCTFDCPPGYRLNPDHSCGVVCADPRLTGCGDQCFDLLSDPRRCGGCGKTADADPGDPNSLGVCSGGSAQVGCKTGFDARCGSPLRCTNRQTDRNNCGACGVVCSNTNGTTACVAGKCVPTCDSAHADCNGNPNDGCEADVSSNATCGSGPGGKCGRCVAPISCVAGETGFFGCATCEQRGLNTCPAGPGVSRCVDKQTDANNCGECGTVCPGGVCKAGHCDSCRVEVPAGFNWQCARNASCQDLFCPNMVNVDGHPLTAHFSGAVIGDSSTYMQLSALHSDGRVNDAETHHCGNELRSAPIGCVLPGPGMNQSPTMSIPGDRTVRVRLYGACGNPGVCRVQPGSVLSIYHQ